MTKTKYLRFICSLSITLSIVTASMPTVGYAQTVPASAKSSADYSKGLQTIEEKVEKRRQELGIPGMSLAIVKDGAVIYSKGLGYKDFKNKVAVTPDTQFAIGSATKAFTALSVLMTADEGKLSLDDSPKKYLPYFKMYDPETDKNMTIRDLLSHTSGLNRTDLAMITGQLNRRELIEVVGNAKPMAKLREKFFYQNIMFAAAGEVVAQTQKTTWEKFVPERIFKPLGMTNSTMNLDDMQKAKDFSRGYEYNFDTKETRELPFRPIDEVAPAGSINSSANDMTGWINFVLNRGVVGGKRLVSEKNYEEWTKKQMNVTPNGSVAYGLGWFIQDWNGLKVVQHGGNIDGFNSMVAMIPEKNLGFVMLTNVSGSPLGGELMPLVWENILGKPEAPKTDNGPTAAAEKEVGKYKFAAAGFDIEIKLQDGKLVAIVPGQPNYVLENVGGRKYKLNGAPDGFFITFKDDSLFLQQPQGDFTLPKSGASSAPADNSAAKELVGRYTGPGNATVDVKEETDGRVTLNITGQQPYALVSKATDEYSLSPLPPAYSLKVIRDATTKVVSFVISQPEGDFEFKKTAAAPETAIKLTVDELMQKAIEAAGGETNLRKVSSRVTVADINFINQGVKAASTSYAKAPNLTATETTMTALGKTIAKGWDFFDGKSGEEVYTFAPVEKYSGKKLEDVRLGADLYSTLNWKTNYQKVELKGTEKVGDEDCYVVELTPEKGTRVTNLYSTKTFLLMKQRGSIASSTSAQMLPYSVTLSDYRDVDGLKLPFKSVNVSPSMGDVITVVKSIKHNVPIEDKIFVSKQLSLK